MSVTVATPAGPLTFTGQESPEARHAAIAKAHGVVAETLHVTFSGPQGHPHTVVPDGEAPAVAGKAPPPSPSALEKQNAFDQEMREKGLQKPPAPPPGQQHPSVPAEQLDTVGIAKLNARYTELMSQFEALPYSQARDRNIEKTRAQFQEEMQEFYQGRKLGEKRSEFKARRDGTAVAPAQQPASPHPPEKWAEAHTKVADKEGWIPLTRINKEGLSGYTLPKFVEGQTYHVGIFQDLANARKQGISQTQVEGFIRAGMVQAGWIKA